MLLKKLTEAMGPSGFEHEIRSVIRDEVKSHVDQMYTDVLGNLFCEKGTDQNFKGPRVLLDAHMDEVGLMIVHAEDNGLLRFRPIGGIDPRVLVSKPVRIGKDKRYGVIGSKPIHLQEDSERKKPLKWEQLFIDIGAKDKEDALKAIRLGDVCVFATEYEEMGFGCAKAKSFDDRVGCAVLVETLQQQSFEFPLYGVFTVQEEIHLRGATAAAYRIKPDIAITLESTPSMNVIGIPGNGQSTNMGEGPALTVQDAHTIADFRFLDFMISVAEKQGIPYQLRRVKGGSNNFAAIQRTASGIIGGVISVPTRYIHAPAQLISLEDYLNTKKLLTAILTEIEKGGFPI